MRSATVVFSGPASPGLTLSPLRRGGIDPCYRVDAEGAIWRTSLMPSGPVTARITRAATDAADCQAWGEGADEFIDRLPALLGVDDDTSGFAPAEPTIAKACNQVPHLRLGRTGRMLEALIPAIIEQRVYGLDAWRAWRALVTRCGTPAPGPAPEGMRVVPSAEVWRRIPSWDFHRANIDPGRARTIVMCAQRADSLERLTHDRAAAGLRSLPGVGEWTAAETMQRVFGDADALSVGDYHLAKLVGQALIGEPVDDATMVELLEPMRPHRHRAVRLLEAGGMFVYHRRTARQAIPKLRTL